MPYLLCIFIDFREISLVTSPDDEKVWLQTGTAAANERITVNCGDRNVRREISVCHPKEIKEKRIGESRSGSRKQSETLYLLVFFFYPLE